MVYSPDIAHDTARAPGRSDPPRTTRSPDRLLISGTPIVGYDGAFARDLAAAHGGGRFVPVGDTAALAAGVAEFHADRAILAGLIGRAGRDGRPFDDETVFRHRCELIRRYL